MNKLIYITVGAGSVIAISYLTVWYLGVLVFLAIWANNVMLSDKFKAKTLIVKETDPRSKKKSFNEKVEEAAIEKGYKSNK